MGTQEWLGEAQAQARKRKKKSQLQPLRIAPCAVGGEAEHALAVVEPRPDPGRLHRWSAERTRADSRRGESALFSGEASAAQENSKESEDAGSVRPRLARKRFKRIASRDRALAEHALAA